MTITLDADQVARAVEKYVRGKNTSDSPHHDYSVRMVWRGEHAVVTITRNPDVPVLTVEPCKHEFTLMSMPKCAKCGVSQGKVRDAKSWGY